MQIPPQISAASIVVLGHFNPLIFRPDWLVEKQIIAGSDAEDVRIDVIHSEVVAFKLPWGQFNVDREKFAIFAVQEPLVQTFDVAVPCFQFLPETPIKALGINREVHFDAGSPAALDRIGDVLAPKEFWGDFVRKDGKKIGGLRSLTMEQASIVDGQPNRLDGSKGWTRAKVQPSLRIQNGAFVQVNDHFDFTDGEKLSNGQRVADFLQANWKDSIAKADGLIDRIMGLAKNAA